MKMERTYMDDFGSEHIEYMSFAALQQAIRFAADGITDRSIGFDDDKLKQFGLI